MVRHEPPQHCVHQSGCTGMLECSRRVHRRVHRCLRGVSRVLDLVDRSNQQAAHFVRHTFRMTQQRLDNGSQAQIPAHRTECDSTHSRSISGAVERCESFI